MMLDLRRLSILATTAASLGVAACEAPTPTCEPPGGTRCTSDGRAAERCRSDGAWGVVQQCEADQTCAVGDDGVAACEESAVPDTCERNKRFCVDGTPDAVWSCSSAGVPDSVYATCADDEECRVESGVAGCFPVGPDRVCDPGRARCSEDGASVETCRADGSGWDISACDGGCSDAGTTAACACGPLGATRCTADGRATERCRSDGAWAVVQGCETDEACAVTDGAAACQPVTNPEACEPLGATRCSADNRATERCRSDGAWAVIALCEASQACVSNNGAAACQSVTFCEPGTVRCAADGAVVEVCADDGFTFEPTENCDEGYTCELADGVGRCKEIPQVCAPTEARCSADGRATETCSGDGRRWLTTACASGLRCASPGGTPACLESCTVGRERCSATGDAVELCAADGVTWQIRTACNANSACLPSLNTYRCGPRGTCTSSKRFCWHNGSQWELWDCSTLGLPSSQFGLCPVGYDCGGPGVANCLTPAICAPGTQRCTTSGGGIETCSADGRAWTTTATCTSGVSCQSDGTSAVCPPPPPICDPGSRRCSTSGSIETCNASGSGWNGGLIICGVADPCRVVDGQATCTRSCTAGTVRCAPNGGGVEVCNDDRFSWMSREACADGQRCHVVGTTPRCGPGQTCAANQRFCWTGGPTSEVWRCSTSGTPSGLYSACNAGQGCAVISGVAQCTACTPGATRCNSAGTGTEACNTAGSAWAASVSCASGDRCASSGDRAWCPDAPRICEPGARRCTSTAGAVEVCDVGGMAWRVATACTGDAQCRADGNTEAACVNPCTAGATRCSAGGGAVETCGVNGWTWTASATCPLGQRCAAAGGGFACSPSSCDPGRRFCYNPPAGGEIWQCDTSGLNPYRYTACPTGQSCVNVAGVASCVAPPICTPGATRCSTTGGGVERCNTTGGAWASLEVCAIGQTCQTDGGAAYCPPPPQICTPGEKRCGSSARWIDTCNAAGTAWEASTSCASTQACRVVGGAPTCLAPCNVGGYPRCNTANTAVEACLDGYAWGVIEACDSNSTCRDVGGRRRCGPASCTPNRRFCHQGPTWEVWSCDAAGKPSGRYSTCGAADTCGNVDGVASCVAPPICTTGLTRCSASGGAAEVCNATGSAWVASQTCAAGRPCEVDAEGDASCPSAPPVCAAGTERCGTNGASVDVCNEAGSAWLALTRCEIGLPCTTTGGAPACGVRAPICSAGAERCTTSGSGVEACRIDGMAWGLLSSCATGTSCRLVDGDPSCTVTCTPGAKRCATSGGAVEVCRNDGLAWEVVAACDSASICRDVAGDKRCGPATCTAGRRFCYAGPTPEVWTCDAAGKPLARYDACDAEETCGVVSGVSTCIAPPICAPGTTRCSASGGAVEICDAVGAGWVTSTWCELGDLCEEVFGEATCPETTPICVPGATRCNTAGDSVETCNTGGFAWAVSTRCETGGTCSPGDASAAFCAAPPAVCDAGDARCTATGSGLESCASDGLSWRLTETCATGATCDEGLNGPACLTLCTPGAVRCATGNGAVERCDVDGRGWTRTETCDAGDGCKLVDGLRRCAPTSCVAGRRFCWSGTREEIWSCNASGVPSGLYQACPADATCGLVSTVPACIVAPVCLAGEKRCGADGGTIEVCKTDGSGWQNSELCSSGSTCTQASGTLACRNPSAICTPLATRCSGDDILTCAANGMSWVVQSRCAQANKTCSETSGTPACVARTMTCSEGYSWNGVDCADIDECAAGTDTCDAICINNAGGWSCESSVSDPSSPYWNRPCIFTQYLGNPTNLKADCRCPENKVITGGLPICWRPHETKNRAPGLVLGAGPRVGSHPQAHIYGGFFDASRREIVAAVDWSNASNPSAGFLMGFTVANGNRRVISGRYLDPANGDMDVGTGPAFADVFDVQRASDGQIFAAQGTLQRFEILRVDPANGNRTLVWKAGDATYGQCASGRGAISVQTTAQGFAVDANGFYIGFSNPSPSGEGLGIIRVSRNGQTCSFVTRSGSRSGNAYFNQPVGGGWTFASGMLSGFAIDGSELIATANFDLSLYGINLSTGQRRRITSASTGAVLGAGPTGSDGLGVRWVTKDASRGVYWTSGRQGDTLVVLVTPSTSQRHDLTGFCAGESSTLDGVNCLKGSITSGLSLNFGGFWLDPANPDRAWFAHDLIGLVEVEVSTGNTIILSL